MKSKFSVMKVMAVTAALAAGVSGVAHADDSSMNPFVGDSYAYFNGGDLPRIGNPVYDNSPSAWRQSHPDGLPESQYQALSGYGLAWKPAPVLDPAPSAWRPSHPQGLSEREFQALSSEGPAWHQPNQSATSAIASTNDATNIQSASREPFGARLARFFHVTPANQTTPAN